MNTSFYLPDNPSSQFMGVPQGGYAVTTGESEKYSLFTSNVSTCVVMTIYDRVMQKGILAHCDAFTKDEESVEKLMRHFTRENIDTSCLEVHLIGGYPNAGEEKVENIKAELRKFNVEVLEIVFTKQPLPPWDYRKAGKLMEKFRSTTDAEEKSRLAKKINALIGIESFSQISLNTKTGEVSTSSDFEHLVENPTKCDDYSEKGRHKHKDLEVKMMKGMKLMNKGLSEAEVMEKSGLSAPIKKVFDGTKG